MAKIQWNRSAKGQAISKCGKCSFIPQSLGKDSKGYYGYIGNTRVTKLCSYQSEVKQEISKKIRENSRQK